MFDNNSYLDEVTNSIDYIIDTLLATPDEAPESEENKEKALKDTTL